MDKSLTLRDFVLGVLQTDVRLRKQIEKVAGRKDEKIILLEYCRFGK